MKTIVLFRLPKLLMIPVYVNLLMLACVPLLHAQSLVYSQVKLVTSQETVPAGKVWKVNNILPSSRLSAAVMPVYNTGASAATEQVITVNGQSIYMASSDSKFFGREYAGGTTSQQTIVGSPIWLPAGTTLASGTGVYAVSITEFTEVP